jgi:hypothetical protein
MEDNFFLVNLKLFLKVLFKMIMAILWKIKSRKNVFFFKYNFFFGSILNSLTFIYKNLIWRNAFRTIIYVKKICYGLILVWESRKIYFLNLYTRNSRRNKYLILIIVRKAKIGKGSVSFIRQSAKGGSVSKYAKWFRVIIGSVSFSVPCQN